MILFNRSRKAALVAAALGGLAACGGSSVDRNASFETLGESFLDSFGVVAASDGPTEYADLPPNGNFKYSGVTVYVEGDQDPVDDEVTLSYLAIGDLVVTANFADDRITGDAQNFYEVTNDPNQVEFVGQTAEPVSGRLEFDIDLSDEQFANTGTGTVTGAINKLNGETAEVDIEIFGTVLEGTDNVLLTNGDEMTTVGQGIFATGTRD